MALSQVSKAIISLVGNHPGCTVFDVTEGLKGMGYEGDAATLGQVPNTVKMLEQHGYLEWAQGNEAVVPRKKGWHVTPKGNDVNKYGG